MKKDQNKTAAIEFNKNEVIDFLSNDESWVTTFEQGVFTVHPVEIFTEKMGFSLADLKDITREFRRGKRSTILDTQVWLNWFADKLGLDIPNPCPGKICSVHPLELSYKLALLVSGGKQFDPGYGHGPICEAYHLRKIILDKLDNAGALTTPVADYLN